MFSSLQRIKGAIDRTIAEEQARSKEGPQSTLSRQSSTSSRGGKSESPSRRPRPKQRPGQDALKGTSEGSSNPDPSIFEAAFSLDDGEDPSRANTPKPPSRTDEKVRSGINDSSEEKAAEASTLADDGEKKNIPESEEKGLASSVAPITELPMDVRVKLRKFERLESTYTELLRSYRIAHSRAKSIEPFERALKENTPLTSISDPASFIEYLSQLNLKGSLVMDELKRISTEKDELKKRCDTQEMELNTHRTGLPTVETSPIAARPAVEKKGETVDNDSTRFEADTSHSSGGPWSTDGAKVRSSSELFSFDAEIRDDSRARTQEIETLKEEVQSLRCELSIAKETGSDLVEKLERATYELSRSRDNGAVKKALESQLEARNTEIAMLTEKLHKAQADFRDLENSMAEERLAQTSATRELKGRADAADSRSKELETELNNLAAAKVKLETQISGLASKISTLEASKCADEKKIEELNERLKEAVPSSNLPSATATGAKKKNKKKKKNAAMAAATPIERPPAMALDPTPSSPTDSINIDVLEAEITRLKENIAGKDETIQKLSKQRRTEEELREEVESMQENLLLIGQEHVEAKERIKVLEAEKKQLLVRIVELEKGAEDAKVNSNAQAELNELQQEYDELKFKASTLHTDLAAAQELAQSRFKDLTELRAILQKAQPELKSLRQEAALLKTTKEELMKKVAEIRALEKKEKELRMDLNRAQRFTADREAEIKILKEKVSAETTSRLRLEDVNRAIGRDLRRSEAEKVEISAKEEKTQRELKQLRELQPKMRELQEQVEKLEITNKRLREETDLKAQQYSSAQGLLDSMRDQTTELTVQLREARSQAESLEEELAEVQRMLGERAREGETMRRLLADVDDRADGQVRDMRTRMEAAIEERDRAEEESSALGRRKARETEDLRQKVRELEREIKSLANVKDELEQREREWKRQRHELESVEQKADTEVAEARAAVSDMKTALDASERQVSDAERQKMELRRLLEEARQKHDRIARDLKLAQAKASSGSVGGRTSIESARSGSSVAGPSPGTPDAMYLKTILLQFLEQKDNRLRAQLVPVLGKLLRFDQADERKWLNVVQRMN